MSRFGIAASLFFGLAAAGVFNCAAASIITVDESGTGTIATGGTTSTLPSFSATDTTNSPLVFNNVLAYGPLPFAGVAGDVEVFVSATPADVIRFNGSSDLFFYSAAGRGANDNSRATQYVPPIPPGPVPNTVILNLTSGTTLSYTPTAGQPGFDAAATPTYDFIFAPTPTPPPTSVPEPGSICLGLLGAAGLVAYRKLRRA